MEDLPKRKPNRLQGYDYTQNGAYFVTVCAKEHEEIFGTIPDVGAVVNRPIQPELSEIGKIIENEISMLQNIRTNVFVDHYVIMPNHVHMIITIDNGRLTTAPTKETTLSEIIRLWKRAVSKQIGFSPWQKSFHDHVIRGEKDYNRIAEYVEYNPARWEDDCFYPQ